MGCTCFSSESKVTCDHKRASENLYVEVDDPNDIGLEIIDDTKSQDTFTIELTDKKATDCPKGKWCMRGVGRPVSQCSAKANECPLRDKPRHGAKDADDERRAAALRMAQDRGRRMSETYARASRERAVRDAILAKFAQAAPQDIYAAIAAWNADKSRPRTGETIYLGASFPPGAQFLYL